MIDENKDGIDDNVATQMHVKHSNRKYNIVVYVSCVLTLLLAYACYKEWLELIPVICGWLVGLVTAYAGINVAQKSVEHRRD